MSFAPGVFVLQYLVQYISYAFQITPTADAIIGEWYLDIDTKFKKTKPDTDSDQNPTYRCSEGSPIIILFNPWCKGMFEFTIKSNNPPKAQNCYFSAPDDTVYMADRKSKQEYVQSDIGLIWRGTHSNIRPSAWNYGQVCCRLVLLD